MLLKLSSSGFLEGLTSKREQVLDKASVCLALCRAEPGGGGATTSGKFPEQWGGGGGTRAAAHATISGSPKGQGCAVMLEGTPMSLFQGNE